MNMIIKRGGGGRYESAYKFAPAVSAGLGARQIRVIASDGTVDQANDILQPSGCDLSIYKNNPIVLFSHDVTKPIGNADVTVSNSAVAALVTFAPEGISKTADEVCGLAKAGVLTGVSIGFTPGDYTPLPSGGYLYKNFTLMEISLVSVPCNNSARVIERGFKSHPAAAPDCPDGVSPFAMLGGTEAAAFRGHIKRRYGDLELKFCEANAARASKMYRAMQAQIPRAAPSVASGNANPFQTLRPAELTEFVRFVYARLGPFEARRCEGNAAYAGRMYKLMLLTIEGRH